MAETKWRRLHLQVPPSLLLAAVLLSLPLRADGLPSSIDGIYRGAIGNQQIIMEMGVVPAGTLNENNGDTKDRQTYPIEGRYFYRSYGVTIHLVGTPLEDGRLRLREYRRLLDDDEFTAEWRLTVQGNTATGTFCKCDLTLPATAPLVKISLKRVSQEYHRESSKDPIYDNLLLSFPLKNGPEIQVNQEIAYVMQTDPRFKVGRPRLTRFSSARTMAKINSQMAAELTWDRLHAAGCLSAGQREAAYGGFYDEQATVSVFPPNIFSILIDRSWYCGDTVHPNESSYTLNYNLRTGKRFTLDRAFQTAKGGFAEADLAFLIANLYQRHYVKPPRVVAAEDCDRVIHRITSRKEELIEAFSPGHATLFMSKDGLVIIPSLVHAYSGCGPSVIVPYAELRPFVKTDSLLRLLVDAGAQKQ